MDSIKEDNTRNLDTSEVKHGEVIDTKNVHAEDVVKFAETLIGIPYRYGSTNPKVGFDCSGFITYVFNHFHIKVPRSSIDFTNVGKEIPLQSAKRGDIILFTGTDSTERFVGHMGIIVSNSDTLRFIHSTSGKQYGVTITPLSKYYQGRFVKTIRVFKQNEG
jgi:cell wall-associated NlpC family hydrolase